MMSRTFDPERDRAFYLEFHVPRLVKFEPEKTGPFNRSNYVASTLDDLIQAHLVGLRETMMPLAQKLDAWMAAQPAPPEGDMSECFRSFEWWQTRGLCRWLVDGDPAEPEFSRASDARWKIWDRFLRLEPNGAKILRLEELERILPLCLAARSHDIGVELCRAAELTDKPSSAPEIARAELMYGRWACRHLADGGQRDATYVAKGEEMLRATMMERFLPRGSFSKVALWLKAIFHDSGVTKTPEQTFFKAYDTLVGVERPAFAKMHQ